MKKIFATFAAVAVLSGISSSAAALTINDPGVVGLLEGMVTGPGGSSVENELVIANNILLLGENATVTATTPAGISCGNGANNQAPCEYRTGINPYSAILSGGEQVTNQPTVLTSAALLSAYILIKFDGQNAGYVLINTADWVAANPGGLLPADGAGIEGWNGGSGTGHYTYFGSRAVPDGGTSLILLGAALGGLGMLRRRMNV